MPTVIQRHDILYNAIREPVMLSLRQGFAVLSLESRGGVPVLYVLADPKAKSDDRFIQLFTTGQEVPAGAMHIGTVPFGDGDRALVCHAFFVPRPTG